MDKTCIILLTITYHSKCDGRDKILHVTHSPPSQIGIHHHHFKKFFSLKVIEIPLVQYLCKSQSLLPFNFFQSCSSFTLFHCTFWCLHDLHTKSYDKIFACSGNICSTFKSYKSYVAQKKARECRTIYTDGDKIQVSKCNYMRTGKWMEKGTRVSRTFTSFLPHNYCTSFPFASLLAVSRWGRRKWRREGNDDNGKTSYTLNMEIAFWILKMNKMQRVWPLKVVHEAPS